MSFHPKTGLPATLCPGCQTWIHWNRQYIHLPDRTRIANDIPGRRWKKPHQCPKCNRQLTDAINPEGRHARDAIGQRKLNEGKP